MNYLAQGPQTQFNSRVYKHADKAGRLLLKNIDESNLSEIQKNYFKHK